MRSIKIRYFGEINKAFEVSIKSLLEDFDFRLTVSNYDHLDGKRILLFEEGRGNDN